MELLVSAGIQFHAGQWAHAGDLVSVVYRIPAASLILDDL